MLPERKDPFMRNKRVGNGRERVMTSGFAISHLLMAYGERCKELEAFNTSEQRWPCSGCRTANSSAGAKGCCGWALFGGEPETCTLVTA